MYTRNLNGWGLLTCVVSCFGLSATQALAIEPEASLRLMRVGDVQYMSGGTNQKERDVLTRRAAAFPVVMSFVGKTNEDRVKRVSVTIVRRDEGNSVIRFKTAGPVLLLSLPPGSYSIAAMSPGAEPVHSQLELIAGKNEALEVTLNTAPPAHTATASAASNRL